MAQYTVVSNVLAGDQTGNPVALAPKLDGVKNEVLALQAGEALSGVSFACTKGSGKAGDTVTVVLEGFLGSVEPVEVEFDACTGSAVNVDSHEFMLIAAEPGQTSTAKVYVQASSDLQAEGVSGVLRVDVAQPVPQA